MYSGTHLRPGQSFRVQAQHYRRRIPLMAVKASDTDAPKPRRTRKTSSSPSTTALPPPSPPPSSDTSTSTATTTTTTTTTERSPLHRLHGTSDTLKSLLERRAERQARQISAAGTSLSTPLPTRPPAPLLPADPPSQRSKVKVRFWMPFRVEYGQSIVVVGSCDELGRWILADGSPLVWSDGDQWNVTVEIPAGTVVEYKYVVVGQGGHAVSWQTGNNSVLALRQADDVLDVYDNWGGDPGAAVVATGAAPVTREARLLSWATELEAQMSSQRQELRRARMELVAAQEDARVAREESKKLKVALAQSEVHRVAAVANLKQAETVNQLLQTQLVETTNSFSEALERALELMGGSGRGSAEKKGGSNGVVTAVTTGINSNGAASSSAAAAAAAAASPTTATSATPTAGKSVPPVGNGTASSTTTMPKTVPVPTPSTTTTTTTVRKSSS